jgi:phenylacetate-CoA ligase
MSVRLRLVGDLMLGDSAICVGFGFGSAYSATSSLQSALSGTAGLLRGADLVLGNLETPLTAGSQQTGQWRRNQMRGRPEVAAVLREIGFTHFNIANNHAMQHGLEAFAETVRSLRAAGIAPIGLRGQDGWACEPVVHEGPESVGLLGYCLRPRQYSLDDPPFAEGPEEAILADVARLSKQADTVAVSLHWGEEFVGRPSRDELVLARRITEAGAALVWGHHPHVVRPVVWQGSGSAATAYSLGNFLADMIWHEETRHGLVLDALVSSGRVQALSAISVRLDGRFLPVSQDPGFIAIDPGVEADPMDQESYRSAVQRTVRAQRLDAYRFALRRFHRFAPGVLSELALTTLRNKVGTLLGRITPVSLADGFYARSPVWLQNVLLSIYGARLRYLRYGRSHRRALGRLQETERLSAAELAELQATELRAVMDRASHTAFYRQHWREAKGNGASEDFTRLPLVSKDDLRRAARALVPDNLGGHRLLEIHTGGTTGTPLTVYCTRSALQRNYAFFSRLRAWAGVPGHPRVATFAGRLVVPSSQTDPPFWRHNRAGNAVLFSSYHISPATLPAYARALAAYQPELIDTYPSSLEPIARHLAESGAAAVRPRAIITSSETLDPQVRRLFERVFGCPVFDHYGAAEMAAFISQCEAGSYHPNPEFGIVEVLTDGRKAGPGEAGEIVATGFVNPAMPLIRYATGDVATVGEEPCRCGRAFPVLRSIEGRRDDVLSTPDGRWIGRLDPIFKSVGSIYETRIVQDALDHVRVEVVPLPGFGSGDEQTLLHQLHERLGATMRIELVQVPSIPRTSRGKFRAVVNLTTPGGVSHLE